VTALTDLNTVPVAVAPAPAVSCTITDNPLGVPALAMFTMARRFNPRRSALFVSPVLGKHIPAPPSLVALAGTALALRVAQETGGRESEVGAAFTDLAAARALVGSVRQDPVKTEPLVVVGFCETATALGHLVRDGLADAPYVHTTRAALGDPALLAFEEEHSHATSHRLYHRDAAVFRGDEPIVLVDDELTSGQTVLNIIAALHAHAPRPRYIVATLLDWREPAAREAYAATEAALGVRIDVVALLTGRVEGALVDGPPPDEPPEPPPGRGAATVIEHHVSLPMPLTARRGWDHADQDALEQALAAAAEPLVAARGTGPAVCIGTEELMYVPLRFAEQLGDDVVFHSTTRSPIVVADIEGYPIRTGCRFAHTTEPDRVSRAYNLRPGAARDVYVFVDDAPPPQRLRPLVASLGTASGAERLHVVYLSSRDSR
jgi:hypothetical protein